ncbi:[FeFe] hydrogenase H-cluster radical SAM maturase HydE [Tepidanaerobacter acetatoxydans]|uniref:[FeFe] hydrogenase H-cluster radical SAM maturase HydE n=1 Tax=Tepidanaerobacter acetatoxydans TaxID=499229 RepID=UPI001BD63A9F|nr:[FeFe] hydrogenase H-cluster radical SAM maturase HydE [Tepidanaerobacter acetatoxydans]
MNIYKLVDSICTGYVPSVDEVELLLNADEPETSYIFDVADNITERYCSNKIHIRGIIEFSNYCRCSCAYCGLNAGNHKLSRYRMQPQEIIDTAAKAYEAGYKTLVLQSGEDVWYTREKISWIIKGIKSIGDIAITLSIGEREYEDYKQWKKDGADRFLLKHETINQSIYNRLHTHSNLESRIKCLMQLKELGYQVGDGFMIGLPGQSLRDIAEDILFLNELDVDMAGIGPFIPHKDTILKDKKAGSNMITLKAVAITRLILKRVHLPATTALWTLDNQDGKKALKAGANVVMLKLEPYKYRRLYEIYPKDFAAKSNIKQERLKIEELILSIGKQIAKDRGDSIKLIERQ